MHAVLFGILGILHLHFSWGIWRQVPTFFWDRVIVVVTSNTFLEGPRGIQPMGSVIFQVAGDTGSPIYSDQVATRYDFGDVAAKTAAYIGRFATGTVHTGYAAPDRSRISLGHFPRKNELSLCLLGLLEMSLALFHIWLCVRRSPSKRCLTAGDRGRRLRASKDCLHRRQTTPSTLD